MKCVNFMEVQKKRNGGNVLRFKDENMELVTLRQIQEAQRCLLDSGLVIQTPLLKDSQAMFPGLGHLHLHLKLENMQTTGSFKIRGVINQLESILHSGELNHKQLVTISAGNYGKAFAYYLQKAGLVGTCIVPLTAAESNVLLLKDMGINVEQTPTWEMQATLDHHILEEGDIFCHPFDDLQLIAGFGTCALEVLDAGIEPDVVLVSCGSGGLVAGVAAALQLVSRKPVLVYAVEPEGSNTMWESMRVRHAVTKPSVQSVASALSPPCTGKLCYAHCKRYVEDVILVSDKEIIDCMKILLDRGIKAEPSGCAALAAILNHRVPDVEGKDVLVLISGGNISVEELHFLIPK
ncbi:uncharacterized protein LOC112572905 isoform X2 [Pomacea canaliculata]|uniref:uncharacterized protein LOC112572905 isoform X2 n=1 Tax=Pomacea canaliculata TaxID=400727 RepID=UPI000D7360E4|nr:uncharacterized protein LOC112572905 isoform X2 [Pomacea canaliculata]